MAVTAMPVGRFASEVHVVPLNCRTCGKLPFPLPPTAKMSVLETAEIPPKDGSAVPGDGAWTTLQLVPLKFSMRSAEPVPPTAQTSVGEMAVTALSVPPVAGVVWMLQDVPLKCSTSGVLTVTPLLLTLKLTPTAQTLLLATALTLENSATDEPAGVGAATTDQLVPLKFSVSGATSPVLVL